MHAQRAVRMSRARRGPAKPPSNHDLPWVCDGPAAGVGVCLSGGGLRAAAFANGAVQALQSRRGLLFGKRCADHLAVVSGGSYLSAALALNSVPPPPGEKPPLHAESAEAEWILGNGEYLNGWRVRARIVLFTLVNVAAFASLFYFAAVALVVLAEVEDRLGLHAPAVVGSGHRVVALAALLGGIYLTLRGLYQVGAVPRIRAGVAGGVLLVAGAPWIVAVMSETAADRDLAGACKIVAALIASSGVIYAFGLKLGNKPPWRLVGWLGARIPALVGLILLSFATSNLAATYDLRDAIGVADVLIPASLLLAGAVSWISGRVSLHRLYRERLATCFSVRRTDTGHELCGDTRTKVSDLKPTEPPRTARSSPRLLICATANVVWDPRAPDYRPSYRHPLRRRTYASFVYSHDRCGMPAAPGAYFETEQLERVRTPAGFTRTREPVLSLMTAVTSTGAAAAPAMGRKTHSIVRTVCALINVRLGRWLPNPMCETIRDEIGGDDADERMRGRRVLGDGFNEFVPELFGLHRADGPRIYISDGGHYDNLGLIALLHARCQEIWCVDAQADRNGKAGQLRSTLRLAQDAIGIPEVDVGPLDELGVGAVRHAILTIAYPEEGSTATLVVIKLGLTTPRLRDEIAPALAESAFPYHKTFWPPNVMWYPMERFNAYREVGYANACAAVDAMQAGA